MKNKLENEVDENSLEYARHFKPKLRFDVGDTVYLKSDLKKQCPMTIKRILVFDDDNDYVICWATSQKNIETGVFTDKVMTT